MDVIISQVSYISESMTLALYIIAFTNMNRHKHIKYIKCFYIKVFGNFQKTETLFVPHGEVKAHLPSTVKSSSLR